MKLAPELVETLESLFGIPAEEASGEAELEADLALDSLAVVELQVAVEERLGVRLRTDPQRPVRTLGDVQELLDEAVRDGEPAVAAADTGIPT